MQQFPQGTLILPGLREETGYPASEYTGPSHFMNIRKDQ